MTPTLSKTNEAALPDFRKRQMPAHIPGLANHWPAIRWNLDRFRQLSKSGGRVLVQEGRESRADYEVANMSLQTTMSLHDFIARLATGEHSNDYYMTARNATKNQWLVDALRNDVHPVAGDLARDLFIWIGPGGTVTPWHHDKCDVIFAQLVGHKQYYTVHKQHSQRMTAPSGPTWDSRWTGQSLRPGPGDAVRPPVQHSLLAPGDGIYLPAGTWHYVESLSTSISVAWCMR